LFLENETHQAKGNLDFQDRTKWYEHG